MTLLAGLGILSFFDRKGMAGMALVTGVGLVTVAFGQLIGFLLLCLDPHIVATTTTATAFDQLVWSHMGCGDRIKGGPAEVVLAVGEGCELLFVTFGAELSSGIFAFL